MQEQRDTQAKFNDFYNSRAASSSNRSGEVGTRGGRGGGKKMKYEDYDNEEEPS